MNNFFIPHLEILPIAQKALLPQLNPLVSFGYVLYGGTAVALQLGHRASVDFDFFTERQLDIKSLYSTLPLLKFATVLQQQADGLTVLHENSNGLGTVKLSFFGGIDFGRVGEPQFTEGEVLLVASLEDLLATKLKVLLQRVEAKDYQDIAAMLNAGMKLENGLAAARALFGKEFQPSESLKALTYFQGGDLSTLSMEEKRILVEAVEKVRQLPIINRISNKLSN
jgi:hypothetical protein